MFLPSRNSAIYVVVISLIALCTTPKARSAATIYVADSGNNTIRSFTSDGVGSVFASSGLNNPRGLAFDISGDLYVANAGSNNILKIRPNGTISTFASSGLNAPRGIAFDHSGNLFVANSGNNTIWKYDTNGVGSLFGISAFSANGPFGLAIDSLNNVFVAGFNEIEKFTPSGARSVFVSGYSYVNNPVGLAMDSADKLYVVNYGSSSITTFTPDGTISRIAHTLPSSGPTNIPYAVAVDYSDGSFYVTITQNNIGVERFTASGTASVFPTSSLSLPTYIAIGPVPEPGVISLMVLGAVAALGYRQRTLD